MKPTKTMQQNKQALTTDQVFSFESIMNFFPSNLPYQTGLFGVFSDD